MADADFLIVGGGVAGLSVAARLAAHGRVLLLEGEDAPGYHSSGRSVTFSHFGIGNDAVRALTAHSRAFFLDPPEGFAPLARRMPALFVADEATVPALDRLEAITRALSAGVERLTPGGIAALCPVARVADGKIVAGFADHDGLKLDGDALLQGFVRALRAAGGTIETGARVASVAHEGGEWRVTTSNGRSVSAPILVNAAGAWADRIAALAGVAPLGLTPLRRTIIVVDPPAGSDPGGWPFLKSVVDEFYLMPEGGRLLVSPVDEVPDDPGDAQPEEYDIALAAHRLTEWTTIDPPRRIAHRWAGLRTFAPGRVPVAGFAPDAPGFFWLAGQGGYGLQTAPAMAAIAAALVTGAPFPAIAGVDPGAIVPG
jgi:D-arginine dehydrogenase